MEWAKRLLEKMSESLHDSLLVDVSELALNARHFQIFLKKEGVSKVLVDYNRDEEDGEETKYYISEIDGDPSVLQNARIVHLDLLYDDPKQPKNATYEITTNKGTVKFKWGHDDNKEENGLLPDLYIKRCAD